MGYLDKTMTAPPMTLEIVKDGKKENVPNEAYTTWMAKDQQLLAFLLKSITKEVLPQVSTMVTSAEV
jgi:hypothetical protein